MFTSWHRYLSHYIRVSCHPTVVQFSFLPQLKEMFTAISSLVVYLFVALELIHLTADMRESVLEIHKGGETEVGRFLSKTTHALVTADFSINEQ